MSFYLLLQSFDVLVDLFTDIEGCTQKFFKGAVFSNLLIVIFQIVLLLIGLLMKGHRGSTKWSDRKNIYVSYEMSQNITSLNITSQ